MHAGNRHKTKQERLIEEHFEAVDAERADDAAGSDGGGGSGSGGGSGDEEDAHAGEGAPRSVVGAGPGLRKAQKVLEGPAGAGGKRMRMLVGKEDASGDLFARSKSVAAVRELPLGERAGADDDAARPRLGRGSGRGPGVWCAHARVRLNVFVTSQRR